MKVRTLSFLFLAAACCLAGCTTQINVQTDPGGAKIRYRGEGRAAFRWKDAPTLGEARFPVRYGRISLYALWPDGVRSETVTIPLSMRRKEENVKLTRPDAVKTAP